ncbi:rCG47688 [Rattus norvegicus]|uniref:RCG47688 n=1 Tax=Rattus norvegicus TaxID=10116 RepID=A6HXP5_RAT|nr:rCG47688 [Rattus norvegicus]
MWGREGPEVSLYLLPSKRPQSRQDLRPKSQEVHGTWANFTARGFYEQPAILWVLGSLRSFKSGLYQSEPQKS